MKKLLLLLLLIVVSFGSVADIESRIYQTMLGALVPQKKSVKVWVDEPKKRSIFSRINRVEVVQDLSKADVIFLYNPQTIKRFPQILQSVQKGAILILVGRYSLLKELKDIAVGGFFWQKGRPNIIFVKKNLARYRIKLPQYLRKYEEDL